MHPSRPLAGLALSLLACNDHPVLSVDALLSAGVHQTAELPARPQIDFLFVVDNSGSMAEEQANLAHNFGFLAQYLHTELGGRADVRVAVTSTDLRRPDGGAFIVPTTPGCEDVGAILSAGPGTDTTSAVDLARKLGCLTALGTQGSSREKGLEAMRLALDCNGPNAASFGACCVDGPEGPGGRRIYDRACTDRPAFLRAEATLAVVFLTDEDDCSDPAANPAASSRALCRTGLPEPGDCEAGESNDACRTRHCEIETQVTLGICRHGPGGLDVAGIPGAYADPTYCRSGNREGCFAAECGGRDAETCHRELCAAPDAGVENRLEQAALYTCQWFPEVLTPVEEFRRFLMGLKNDPHRQLIVASLTGTPRRTEAGNVVRSVLPVIAGDPACELTPESTPTEACCPGGFCEGPPTAACQSDFGDAATGLRYLELAESFGSRGLGCSPEGDGDPDGECVSLCDGDLASAVERLTDTLAAVWRCFCLDAPPAAGRLSVQMSCTDGTCAPRRLGDSEWHLESERTDCATGRAVCLEDLPPPRARLSFDYARALGDTEER